MRTTFATYALLLLFTLSPVTTAQVSHSVVDRDAQVLLEHDFTVFDPHYKEKRASRVNRTYTLAIAIGNDGGVVHVFSRLITTDHNPIAPLPVRASFP
jgi:hypothetical protein